MKEDKVQVPVGMMGLGIWSRGLPEEPQLQGCPNQSPPLEKPFIPLSIRLLRGKARLLEKTGAHPDLMVELEGVTPALSHQAQTPLH